MPAAEECRPIALHLNTLSAPLYQRRVESFATLPFPAPSEHGTPEPWTLVWFGGTIEAAGRALLAVGLFTRAVAFVTSGEMAVAYWMVHAPTSFYPVVNHGDLAILFCLVFLLFVFVGPGVWSLDGLLTTFLLRRKKT